MRVLRLIGIGAHGVHQGWISVTIAAATGGHRLTLFHGIKAAGAHSRSDVLATILVRTRRRRRCHRYKSQRKQRRGGRGAHFKKLFHLVFLSANALFR
jgi:hypothetical protein